MRNQINKRNALLLVLLLVLAAGAYAYFSSVGSGTGEATVGSSTDLVLSSDPVGDLYPGGADVPVTVDFTNPGSGDEHIGTISGAVEDNDNGTPLDSSDDCLGAWFEVDDVIVNETLAPSAADSADTNVRMLDPGFSGPIGSGATAGTDQDNCQGDTLTINWLSN